MAETVVWVDADGASLTLEVEWSTRGRFAPPAVYEVEGVPLQPGERLRAVRHGTREFVLPLWITAASETQLRTDMRTLVARMDPLRGDGKIRVTAPGGDQREITCRYQAGLDLDESLGSMSGPLLQRAAVIFRASDPYWYDTSDTITEYTTGATATFFPLFPMRLSSSEVFADATTDNTGDVECWPVWDFTGPGSAIVARHLTTGELLSLPSLTLGAGEVLTVDTRPGQKTVTTQDGANQYPQLSTTSAMWSLRRGSNAVRVEMTGATSASRVRLARRHRYLSP